MCQFLLVQLFLFTLAQKLFSVRWKIVVGTQRRFFFFFLSESKKWQKCPKQSVYFTGVFAASQDIEALLKHLFPDKSGSLFLK